MNFLKLTLFATRVLGLGLRLRQIASTRRRVNAKRTEVRAQKLVKQLPSQFMFVLALLGAVGQVAALPLLACEMMVTPAGALNCHLGMHPDRKRMAGLTTIHFCTAGPLQVISRRLIALPQQSVTKLAGLRGCYWL